MTSAITKNGVFKKYILYTYTGCGNITSLFQKAIKQDIEIRKVLILFHIEITS